MRAALMAVNAALVFALPGVVLLEGVDAAIKAGVVLLMGTANVGLTTYLAEAYGQAIKAAFRPYGRRG